MGYSQGAGVSGLEGAGKQKIAKRKLRVEGILAKLTGFFLKAGQKLIHQRQRMGNRHRYQG